MQGMEIEVERKRQCRPPTTLVSEPTVAPQRASDAISFKNPDEILEAVKGEL